MSEILALHQAQGGAAFDACYGPSGMLRKEIENGRRVDVFASASAGHTDALARQGLLGASNVFARNELCVVASPQAGIRPERLLEALSDPALRLATSTPLNDPMGDYTWQFFRKADERQPGMYAVLDAKAIKLSGGAQPAPDSPSPYISAFEQDLADAYIMYRTNAVLTKKAVPRLDIFPIPDNLNVRAEYGIAARAGSREGEQLLWLVSSAAGRGIFQKYGFH